MTSNILSYPNFHPAIRTDVNVTGSLDFNVVPTDPAYSPYSVNIAVPQLSSLNSQVSFDNVVVPPNVWQRVPIPKGEILGAVNVEPTQRQLEQATYEQRWQRSTTIDNILASGRENTYGNWAKPGDFTADGRFEKQTFAQGEIIQLKTPHGWNYDRYVDPGEQKGNLRQTGFGGQQSVVFKGANTLAGQPVAPQFVRTKDLAFDVGPIMGWGSRSVQQQPSYYIESVNQRFTQQSDPSGYFNAPSILDE